MRLRVVGYQVQVRLRTLLPCFHKAHIENLALMVVGAFTGHQGPSRAPAEPGVTVH